MLIKIQMIIDATTRLDMPINLFLLTVLLFCKAISNLIAKKYKYVVKKIKTPINTNIPRMVSVDTA